MLPFIIGILVLWLVIHVAHNLVHRRQNTSVLPIQHNIRRSKATVTLKSLHLKVQTTSFNRLHDVLTTRLQKNGYGTILESFYDLGTFICAFGMTVAIGLLVWTFIGLIQDLRHSNVPHLFTKRDLSDEEHIFVKPIVCNGCPQLPPADCAASGPYCTSQFSARHHCGSIFVTIYP